MRSLTSDIMIEITYNLLEHKHKAWMHPYPNLNE
jgi:hypothetical protein